MRSPSIPVRLALTLPILAALAVAGASAHADDNLLAGLRPSTASGVSNVAVLTDGAAAYEGAEWNTTVSAPFRSERSFVEFDLGRSVPLRAAYIQGDNNDEYILTASEDHRTFAQFWAAGPRPEAGLRDRWADNLTGQGRWIRVGVHGGDSAYSVSEVQVFENPPAKMPPPLRRVAGESQAARVRTCFLYLVVGFALFLFATDARSPWWRTLLAATAPLVAAALTVGGLRDAWPLGGREVAFIRAAAAGIALGAVARVAIPGRRWPPRRAAVTAALAVAAALAFAAFYNMGRPQFYDHLHGHPEFVHTNDLRVYQPFAKYFAELQYDGVYAASILAYAEDRRGGSLDSLGYQEVRGLTDHRVRRVRDMEDEIRSVRQRFSDARWEEFKKDMRYFEDVMGPEYLSTLTDHGANATPVWVFFARTLLAHAPASEGLLVAAGLVDMVLLLLMALALWRAFGIWPMLLALAVFGANDLYMFGTNWTGATLRHDWLAMLGFGAAALKLRRWTLAGICLALSALIRAFPVVALLGVMLPALWAFLERWRRDRRFPRLRSIWATHPETIRVLASAATCAVFMVLLTGVLYSFKSWGSWFQKVTLLNRDVGVNEISLRALIAGADNAAGAVLQARMAIFVLAEILAIACVAVLARRRPLHQAMILTVPLVLIISNPSNYYSHFIFLLALLADVGRERSPIGPLAPQAAAPPDPRQLEDGPAPEAPVSLPPSPDAPVPLIVRFESVAAPLLALCVGGYWASLEPDLDRHFQDGTILLFAAFVWLYVNLLRADPALRSFLDREPPAAGPTPPLAGVG